MKPIVDITKQEAHALHKEGVPFGEGGISHTYTSHRRYFLCESKKNLRLLDKLRNIK